MDNSTATAHKTWHCTLSRYIHLLWSTHTRHAEGEPPLPQPSPVRTTINSPPLQSHAYPTIRIDVTSEMSTRHRTFQTIKGTPPPIPPPDGHKANCIICIIASLASNSVPKSVGTMFPSSQLRATRVSRCWRTTCPKVTRWKHAHAGRKRVRGRRSAVE